MSDLPSIEFKFAVELKFSDEPPRAVLKDVNGDATASTDVELDPAPPYTVGMVFSADRTTGDLKPELKRLAAILPPRPLPFDPALAGDDGVLSIDWDFLKPAPRTDDPAKTDDPRRAVHNLWIETQDKATLQVVLYNRSNYYEAEDLKITIRATLPDGNKPHNRPNGDELLSIWPEVQAVRSIPPTETHRFYYLVVARGPQAGLYTIEIHVDYTLVYVYRETCRETRAVAHLPLHVHGGSAPPVPGGLRPLSSTNYPQLERISPQRRLHMSEQGIDRGHSSKHDLHLIERRIPLAGGGELVIRYRLVKGSHTRPDDSRPSYGWNPNTKAAESYFSTADQAAMEITIFNPNKLHLKHIRLDNVGLFHQNQDGEFKAVNDKLPDGNFLFEVLPNDVYFGSLEHGQQCTRYLGLITRGIGAGKYFVHFDVGYEIVDASVAMDLSVEVRPD